MSIFARIALAALFSTVFFMRGTAQATGPDCSAAKSKAERLICSEKAKGVSAPVPRWQTYRDAKLGISFDYRSNRRVVPCPGRPNCVALVGPGMTLSDYFLAFEVVNKPLDQAATDNADFVKQDGKWMAQAGPGEPQEAVAFSGKGWKGLKATIACGVSDSLGFHAGAGNCFWAVMSNGKRSVVADTQGLVGTDANTMRSVSSLQFDR